MALFRLLLKLSALLWWGRGASSSTAADGGATGKAAAAIKRPFGTEFPNLDSLAVGDRWQNQKPKGPNPPPSKDAPRDQIVAFALDTVDHGVLKLTAQLFPLKPGEQREARLEFFRDDNWSVAVAAPVLFPGWSAHFRIENRDDSQTWVRLPPAFLA